MRKKHSFPQFCTSVTLYRKIKEKSADGKTTVSYRREVFDGCFWGVKEERKLSESALEAENTYICRLPLCDVSPGDVLFKGVVSPAVSDRAGMRMSDWILKKKPNCFTVMRVRRNDSVSYLAHTRAEGV